MLSAPGQAGTQSEGRHKAILGSLAAAVRAADTLELSTGLPFHGEQIAEFRIETHIIIFSYHVENHSNTRYWTSGGQ